MKKLTSGIFAILLSVGLLSNTMVNCLSHGVFVPLTKEQKTKKEKEMRAIEKHRRALKAAIERRELANTEDDAEKADQKIKEEAEKAQSYVKRFGRAWQEMDPLMKTLIVSAGIALATVTAGAVNYGIYGTEGRAAKVGNYLSDAAKTTWQAAKEWSPFASKATPTLNERLGNMTASEIEGDFIRNDDRSKRMRLVDKIIEDEAIAQIEAANMLLQKSN